MFYLFKYGQRCLIFVYFRPFHKKIKYKLEKAEIRTRSFRMVGPDRSTELWRPPSKPNVTLDVVYPDARTLRRLALQGGVVVEGDAVRRQDPLDADAAKVSTR